MRQLRRLVSTHAPARGQSQKTEQEQRDQNGFNSCPREGAIRIRHNLSPFIFVSTHAPARGQSKCTCPKCGFKFVSTHAPARGQSPTVNGLSLSTDCFNSCPREGAIFENFGEIGECQSFNSCPREGAIQMHLPEVWIQVCFNSCPREGAIPDRKRLIAIH